MALATVLYSRNRETIMAVLEQARQEAARRKAAKAAENNGGTPDEPIIHRVTPEGEVIE
jgi:hypothetical protein